MNPKEMFGLLGFDACYMHTEKSRNERIRIEKLMSKGLDTEHTEYISMMYCITANRLSKIPSIGGDRF